MTEYIDRYEVMNMLEQIERTKGFDAHSDGVWDGIEKAKKAITKIRSADVVTKKEAEKMRNEIHYWMQKCEKYERTILDLAVRESERKSDIRITSDGIEVVKRRADNG